MNTGTRSRLNPTLWRTCRVLANRLRLSMLLQVLRSQGLTVAQVAVQTRTSRPVASLYLRALNARGLLAARRLGRHVFYHAEADASMTAASALLDAIRKEAAGHSDPVQPLYRAATAFTHPRRTLIVRALAAGPADFAALRADTGISRDALGRHLRKLLVRRVVVLRDGAYRCATPRTPIARALLQLAQSG